MKPQIASGLTDNLRPDGASPVAAHVDIAWGAQAVGTPVTLMSLRPPRGFVWVVTELQFYALVPSSSGAGGLEELPAHALDGVLEFLVETDGQTLQFQNAVRPAWGGGAALTGWGLLQTPLSAGGLGIPFPWVVRQRGRVRAVERLAPRFWIEKVGLRLAAAALPAQLEQTYRAAASQMGVHGPGGPPPGSSEP